MNGIQSIASALLLLFVTMFASPVMAQEDGEKAGIHYVMFKMDEELMSAVFWMDIRSLQSFQCLLWIQLRIT